MTTVHVTTLEYHDDQSNSHKMYRTYEAAHIVVFQWGRIGTAGQFNAQRCVSQSDAVRVARAKRDEKEAGGYNQIARGQFEYSGTVDPDDKDTLKRLAQAAGTTPISSPVPAVPDPTPAPAADPTPVPATDPHAAFTARALDAVNLAVTDPARAMVELAVLREQFTELEKIHRKAASYLSTLDRMLLTAVDA